MQNPTPAPAPAPALLLTLASVVAAAATPALAQVPQSWDIDIIARSSLDPAIPAFRLPPGSSLSSQPVSLDDLGGIAVRAFLSGAVSGNLTEVVFYGTRDDAVFIATANNPNDVAFGPAVDAFGGRVAVPDAFFNGGGATVYDTFGVELERFDPGGPLAISGIGGPTLSADGAIAYRGDFGFIGDRVVIDEFVNGVRTQTPIADDFSGTFDFLLTPRMNANRQVVINTIPASGPSRRIIRFDPTPGGPTAFTVAETGARWDSFVNSTGIGTDGSISFTARRTADGIREVVLADPQGNFTTIAEGNQNGISNANLANFPPVNNANGLAAFRVEDTSGSTALYVGDGSDLVRIVGAGEPLPTDLGSIPAGFDFGGTTGVQTINSSIDINDQNQIAFAAFLQNGTIGVFLATPAPADPPCNIADLAVPFGFVDLSDVDAFIAAFATGDPLADIAAPFGFVDLTDVDAFIAAFLAGCP
ncbi:MAG: GC-type dockerin domain-anchored protein [Planctomycetota bacterium]